MFPVLGSGKAEVVLVLNLALVLILPPHVPALELTVDPLCSLTCTGTRSPGPPTSESSSMVTRRLTITQSTTGLIYTVLVP